MTICNCEFYYLRYLCIENDRKWGNTTKKSVFSLFSWELPTVPHGRCSFISQTILVIQGHWHPFYWMSGAFYCALRVKSAKIYKSYGSISDNASPLKTIPKTGRMFKQRTQRRLYFVTWQSYRILFGCCLRGNETVRYDKIIILPLFSLCVFVIGFGKFKKYGEYIQMVGHTQYWNCFSILWRRFLHSDTSWSGKKHDISSLIILIMSYHGLPDRHVDKVYEGKDNLCSHHMWNGHGRRQQILKHFLWNFASYCTRTVTRRSIYRFLSIEIDDKWLTPFSDKVIEDFAKEGKKNYLSFPQHLLLIAWKPWLKSVMSIKIFEEERWRTIQL